MVFMLQRNTLSQLCSHVLEGTHLTRRSNTIFGWKPVAIPRQAVDGILENEDEI